MSAQTIHYVAEGAGGKARVIENADGTFSLQFAWAPDTWLYVTDTSDEDLGRLYYNTLDRARRAARAYSRNLELKVVAC